MCKLCGHRREHEFCPKFYSYTGAIIYFCRYLSGRYNGRQGYILFLCIFYESGISKHFVHQTNLVVKKYDLGIVLIFISDGDKDSEMQILNVKSIELVYILASKCNQALCCTDRLCL